MHDPKILRGQARRCRALMKTVIELEAIEQLRLWAPSWPKRLTTWSGLPMPVLHLIRGPVEGRPDARGEGRFAPHQHRELLHYAGGSAWPTS
jgi:hypothetical protein